MEAIKEVAIPVGKELVMLAAGLVTVNLPELDYLPEFVVVNEWAKLITDILHYALGIWFFIRALAMLNRRIKGKELDNKLKEKQLKDSLD